MPNPQHDSSSDWPASYDPYTDDGFKSPTQEPLEPGDGKSLNVKESGISNDTRDGALKYGKQAPRIT